MRILILQSEMLRNYSSLSRLEINNYIYNKIGNRIDNLEDGVIRKIYRKFFYPLKNYISPELPHYGDIPSINGLDNTYYIDDMNPYVFEKNVEKYKYLDWQNYPVCFGFSKPNFISFKNALNNINKFDAIIYSVHANRRFRPLLKKAKKQGILVAIFDNIDHEAVYLQNNLLRRDFGEYEHDIYFKKDIPKGHLQKGLYPIAPVPTREENEISIIEAKNGPNIFFVGGYRKNVTRNDRKEICNLLSENIIDTDIRINKNHISEEEYENIAVNSKILLSPAGRVWCSYRHTNLAKYQLPLIVPSANCETVKGSFIDGIDCLEYDAQQRDGEYLFDIKNKNKLLDKVEYFLQNMSESEKMGKKFHENVQKYHTTKKRSEYLLNIIERNVINGC